MMLYIALRIAHEIIKESQRRKKRKKDFGRQCPKSTATAFSTGSGKTTTWTNARW